MIIAGVLIQVLQATTRHYSEHTGVTRAMLWLAEMLSIVTSRGRKVALTVPSRIKQLGQSVTSEDKKDGQ